MKSTAFASIILCYAVPTMLLIMAVRPEYTFVVPLVVVGLNVAKDVLSHVSTQVFIRQAAEGAYFKCVRTLHADDPIMATAVWKKANPGTTPPWHLEAEGESQR